MDNSHLDSYFEQGYILNKIVKESGSEEINTSIIKVIGVGGGGGNAVNYMYEKKIKDVEFVITNTDRQVLLKSPIPTKIQLGATLTQGLGTGMDVNHGRNAALESIDDIKAVLGGSTKMVFITAGMGGGTGTGAAPVIAKVAREMGLLTVSVVTAPYSWEGSAKKKQALEGIAELQENSDTVLVVLNDKLEELFEDLTLSKAFAEADNILLNAVKSISEIITTSGNINTDFRDVEKVLKDAKQSVMGTADAEGSERALEAIVRALDSPLLNDRNIAGAQSIIVTLASSRRKEATVKEQRIITKYVTEQVQGDHSLFKLGTIIDEALGDSLRVTIVASGFDKNDTGSIRIPEREKEESNAPAEDPSAELNVEKEKTIDVSSAQPAEAPGKPESSAAEVSPVDIVSDGYIKEEISRKELELESTPTGPAAVAELEEDQHLRIFYPDGKVFETGSAGETASRKVDEWSEEEKNRIREMVKKFGSGKVSWLELEAPAFKRNSLSLWDRPDIPSGEFEKHRLHLA